MMRKNLPKPNGFIGKTLTRFPSHEILQHLGTGNNGHVFLARDGNTNHRMAIKFVPVENIRNHDAANAYLDEARAPNLLGHRSVVDYSAAFPWTAPSEWNTPELEREFIVFACDYVDGTSLRSYLDDRDSEVTISFVKEYLRCMFELLHELKARSMVHGDLHAGNVLVERPEYDLYNRPTFRVTDFGVSDIAPSSAKRSDFLSVAETLRLMLDAIDYTDCPSQDRFAFEILRNDFLARHLIETDTLADPLARNPQAMEQKLSSFDTMYADARNSRTETDLTTPFDYPNCEQIGSSNLLLKNLYSDRVLGLSQIESLANVVVTGPRGCGKTTVFRALSLRYRMSVSNDAPETVRYVGTYYRCDDLYFAFPRYKAHLKGNGTDVPMHFLTVTLLAELLATVLAWGQKHFPESLASREANLSQELRSLLRLPDAQDLGQARLEALIATLKGRERKRAQRKQQMLHREEATNYCGPEVLIQACAALRAHLPFLTNRPFCFFIDDYSEPKITRALQQNLNRLLMHRGPDLFFKLSTESPVSFARDDIDGKSYVENREYELLNLGLRFLDSPDKGLEFLRDLFRKRFALVKGYPVSDLSQMLGSEARNENESARTIRDKRRRGAYAGEHTIAAMCSGDIHYVLRLVQRMVEDFGGVDALGDTDAQPKIPINDQHNSIRAAAGEFLEQVRTLPRCGERLAGIVTAFGQVAYSFLRYRDSKNENGRPPHQASRIEPYEALNLTASERETLHELLRYSIFIEDPRGRSRRGHVVPRFYLRRYLVPHFWLTFSRRDSIELEPENFSLLLKDPKKFEKQFRLRARPHREDSTRDMFRDE